jgi:hypothetical protein
VRGVFAQVFCDFGPAFQVLDVDGEQLLRLVSSALLLSFFLFVLVVHDSLGVMVVLLSYMLVLGKGQRWWWCWW